MRVGIGREGRWPLLPACRGRSEAEEVDFCGRATIWCVACRNSLLRLVRPCHVHVNWRLTGSWGLTRSEAKLRKTDSEPLLPAAASLCWSSAWCTWKAWLPSGSSGGTHTPSRPPSAEQPASRSDSGMSSTSIWASSSPPCSDLSFFYHLSLARAEACWHAASVGLVPWHPDRSPRCTLPSRLGGRSRGTPRILRPGGGQTPVFSLQILAWCCLCSCAG